MSEKERLNLFIAKTLVLLHKENMTLMSMIPTGEPADGEGPVKHYEKELRKILESSFSDGEKKDAEKGEKE